MISLINGTWSSSFSVRGGNKFCKMSVVIKSHLKLQVAIKSTIPAHERPNLASLDDNIFRCSNIENIIVLKIINEIILMMINNQLDNIYK